MPAPRVCFTACIRTAACTSSSKPSRRSRIWACTEYADALVYADIHETLMLDVEGRPLINCGSVGNPLDSTLPSYLILEFAESGPSYSAQFVRLTYNREAEIAAAEASGMPFTREYIAELLTGAYQKRRARGGEEGAGLGITCPASPPRGLARRCPAES